MQICKVCKVCKGWLRIFLAAKSPDEGVITKQACKDESTVCFFFLSQHVYIKRTLDFFLFTLLKHQKSSTYRLKDERFGDIAAGKMQICFYLNLNWTFDHSVTVDRLRFSAFLFPLELQN